MRLTITSSADRHQKRDSHFLKMLGKLDFMFLMLVTTEGVGRDAKFLADLNATGGSSPSTGRFLSVNLSGFSMYCGNFSIVHE